MILNKSIRIRSTLFPSALLSPRVAHARFAGVVGRGARCQRWFFSLDGKKESQNVEFSTLYELQSAACKTFAPNNLFGTYREKLHDFEYMSYNDFGKEVDRCRTVLRNLGVREYERVAIISNNRWEWAAIAMAAFSMKASIVPMYEAQLPSDWVYILNDSGSSVVFCATQDIHERLQRDVLGSTPSVQAALCLDAPEGDPHAFATEMNKTYDGDRDRILVAPPVPEDLADLIYTSGTTGNPKGVELTHANFVSNIKGAKKIVDDPRDLVYENDRSLAFLPWAHSYGQTCELWMGLSQGASMGICRGISTILEDLQLVRPTVLFSVPALYKKVHDGLHNTMAAASPLRKLMMQQALAIGRINALSRSGQRGPLGPIEQLQYSVLDRLVLSKIRDKFGGRMRYGCVAGAACPIEVLNFMDSLGIPICEGYGLTETSPMITINVPGSRLPGSVGRAIGGVAVHIVGEDGQSLPPGEDGEICCTGPNIMKGYHNNNEATKEVISIAPDGISRMFHTGDLGQLDEDGWLRVTGRIKEQYKLENGKYVAPAAIEMAISSSRFIFQVVLCGANRPYNIALIVPDWETIRTELQVGNHVSELELADDERVRRLIDGEIASCCAHRKKFEIPVKWAIVAPFTAANKMMTPKMSIRRHRVVEAYEDLISHFYGEAPVKDLLDNSSAIPTNEAA